MAVVTHAIRTLLKADGATFVLRDGSRCFYVEEDAISPLWKGQRFPMSACISGWCMLHSQAVAIPDIQRDPRIPQEAYRPTFVRSLAMAPVRRDAPLAALGAYWSEAREIQPGDLELLQAIADSTALSVAYLDVRRAGAAPEAEPRRKSPKVGLRADLAARLERVRHVGLPANSAAAYAVAVGLVVVATLMRFGFESLGIPGLAPFATYYPAVVLSVILGGLGPGVAAAVLGGGFAQWAFLDPAFSTTYPDRSHLANLALYALAATLTIWILQRYRRAIRSFIREDARRISLTREAEHRTRNLLALVQNIVRQSLRSNPEKATEINERILASQAHVLQAALGGKPPSDVRSILAAALSPFDLSRFTLIGDEAAPLPPELGTVLSMAAHELATNAAKHGALSRPEGRVTVMWSVEDQHRAIRWSERHGPAVAPPERQGYGSVFLRRLLEGVHGSIETAFPPTGVTVDIRMPLHAGRGA